MARRLRFDRLLFAAVLGLTLFGLVMVYSASAVVAAAKGGDPYHFATRQISAVFAGCVLGTVAFLVDYRTWRKPAWLVPMLGATAVCLVAVLFQRKLNNTHRWIHLGSLSFQPSELAKLPLIVFLAHWLDRKQERMDDFGGTIVPAAALVSAFTALVLIEPDFGTSMVILGVAMILFFVAGVPALWFAGTAAAALPVLGFLLTREEYRVRRLMAFVNPEADPLGDGYQPLQSLIAHGTGGWFGSGLGYGRQKLFFLPYSHTDFVYSIIAEELGLIGAVLTLAVFAFIFWRAIRAAKSAPDRYGFYLAIGIGSMIFVQALIHASVTLSLLPTKGLPLPFISYGRSYLLTCLVGAGVLLNISQHGE